MNYNFMQGVFKVILSALLVSVVSLFLKFEIAEAAPDVNVYAELPRTSSVRVSPDGRYVAMLSPYKGSKGIFIYDLMNPDAKTKVIPSPKNSIVKSVIWGSNRHVLMQGQSRHFYGGGNGKFRDQEDNWFIYYPMMIIMCS